MQRLIIQRVFLILFGLLLGLGLSEIALGVTKSLWFLHGAPDLGANPQSTRFLFNQFDPILGYTGIPSITKQFRGKTVVHNPRGERGPLVSFERTPGIPRLLLLGDSQAWSYGLSETDSLHQILQDVVEQVCHLPAIEIVNLGVSGYGPDQYLLKYLLEGERYHPDIVLAIFFTSNDLYELSTDRAWNVFKPTLRFVNESVCVDNIPVQQVVGWTSANWPTKLSAILDYLPFTKYLSLYQFFTHRSLPPVPQSIADTRAVLAQLSQPAAKILVGRSEQFQGEGECRLETPYTPPLLQQSSTLFQQILHALQVRIGPDKMLLTAAVPSLSDFKEKSPSLWFQQIHAALSTQGHHYIPLLTLFQGLLITQDQMTAEDFYVNYNGYPDWHLSRLAVEQLAHAVADQICPSDRQ